MALSQAVVRELQEELGRLQHDRAKIDDHINSLQAVLVSLAAGRNGHTGRQVTTIASGRIRNEVTLRASIVEILRTSPTGADTSEVTKVLEERGFRIGGTTSLRERAAHELRLLKMKGLVRRTRTKKYRLLQAPSNGGSSGQTPS